MIRAILHADKNWGIGKNNSLMFSIPKDMKFFRETTLGKTVVMGGNTLRSFPAGKPLKNRTNIVLSRGQVMDDCLVVSDLEALKAEMRRRAETEDLYVIGGASVYQALLGKCDTAYITKIHKAYPADCWLPDLDADPNWTLAEESEPLEENGLIFHYATYKRT